jgi:hypothetical protein
MNFFFDNDSIMDGTFFWDQVKAEIRLQNTTQEWLAQKIDMPLGTFKQQIHYKRLPDAVQAVRLAAALGSTVEYLVTGKPPAGLSPEALEVARAAELLNGAGKQAALAAVRGLETAFPLGGSALSNKA